MIFNVTRKNGSHRTVGVLLFALLFSGCATTEVKKPSRLELITTELALQLSYPATVAAEVRQRKLTTTLFVDAEDLEATSRFGYLLRSSLENELQKRGFQMSRLLQELPAVQILLGGDLHNNREIRLQLLQNEVDYLLTASITHFDNGALVNVQVIEISTAKVLLSAQTELSKREYAYFINDRNIKLQYRERSNGAF